MRTSRVAATIAAAFALLVPLAVRANAATEPDVVDFSITSFDGTPIVGHFFPATGIQPGQRAPVIFVAHGYGESSPSTRTGARLAGAPKVLDLVDAGFNVLTWDARGMGSSGGTARFDSPDAEVRDVEGLIDWAATRPEVQLDGPGDPRMGMAGASYGGLIQYSTAALDPRVDAIAPAYTGYSLSDTTMTANGKFKEGWGLLLTAITAETVPPGITSPLGPQIHAMDPPVVTGMADSLALGTLAPDFKTYLDYRSPSTYLSQINIPTFIIGGTSDTLFPLTNADRDYRALKARHVPVAMEWNCEGHSICPGSTGPLESEFDSSEIAWFTHYLIDKKTPLPPAFTWIADNEASYRTADAYPAPAAGTLSGSGSGSLGLTAAGPLTSISVPELDAQPSSTGLSIPINAPTTDTNVVGFPTLNLTYSGFALPGQSWVYAQIVDQVEGRVVNGQITPIPVVLDGLTHQLTVPLNAISSRATASSRYALQLVSGSLIFGLQRSSGLVDFTSVQVALPTS